MNDRTQNRKLFVRFPSSPRSSQEPFHTKKIEIPRETNDRESILFKRTKKSEVKRVARKTALSHRIASRPYSEHVEKTRGTPSILWVARIGLVRNMGQVGGYRLTRLQMGSP